MKSLSNRRILSLIVTENYLTDEYLPIFNQLFECEAIDIMQLRPARTTRNSLRIMHTIVDMSRSKPSAVVINVGKSKKIYCGDENHPFDGVHYPEEKIAALHQQGKKFATNNLITSGSVHSTQNAVVAAQMGFAYVQVGTMFHTLSHPDKYTLEGPEMLTAIQNEYQRFLRSNPAGQLDFQETPRIIAVGGITKDNAAEVLSAGANGIAVIRSILDNDDPVKAALSFRDILN